MRQFFILAALAAFTISPAAAVDGPIPTDDTQFATYVAAEFSKAFPDWAVSVDPPQTIVLVAPSRNPRGKTVIGPMTSKYETAELHRNCLQKPTDCEALIDVALNNIYFSDQIVSRSVEAVFYRRPELDTTKILATIVDDWTEAKLVELNHGPYRRITVKTFGSLWIGCTPDIAAAPAYLVQKDLDRLDMSAEDTVALCIKNTLAILPPFAQSLRDVAPGEIGVLSGAGESLLILAHDQWATVANRNRFNGDLIVSVPDENTLLYSRGSGPLAIQAIVDRAKSIRGRKPPIVDPTIYKWSPSGWDIVSPAG